MTPIRIRNQGSPIANEATVIIQAENIVAIELDMKSKNCEYMGTIGSSGAADDDYDAIKKFSLTRKIPASQQAKWQIRVAGLYPPC